MANTYDVSTQHSDYLKMMSVWQRCRDCYGGADTVKKQSTLYLPMLDSHKAPGGTTAYTDYVMRAVFFNGTFRTVKGLTGAIFQKAPTVNFPDAIRQHLDDANLANDPAETFAFNAVEQVITTGRYGILVDMAMDPAEPRPYWVGYACEDIINWRTTRFGGNEYLTLVVLREEYERTDEANVFYSECQIRYRVLRLQRLGATWVYRQEIWEEVTNKNAQKQWVLSQTIEPKRRGIPLPFIPFVLLGPQGITPGVSRPPILDLVDMNLAHYRNSADYEHGLHWTGLPTPWVAANVDAQSGPLYIGSSKAWILGTGGSAGMLQADGEMLGALTAALAEKKKSMATLGARLLDETADVAETATAVNMKHSGEHATLRTIAQALELALTLVLKWHVWWLGTMERVTDLDAKTASYELNKDFFAIKMSSGELQALVGALQADAISFDTFWSLLIKGGLARMGVDAKQEKQDIEAGIQERMARAPDLTGVNPEDVGMDPADKTPPVAKDGPPGGPVA